MPGSSCFNRTSYSTEVFFDPLGSVLHRHSATQDFLFHPIPVPKAYHAGPHFHPFPMSNHHPSIPSTPPPANPTQNRKRPHPPGPSVPRPCRSWRFSWRYCPWTRPRPPARAVAWAAAAAWAPRHAPRPGLGPTALPGRGGRMGREVGRDHVFGCHVAFFSSRFFL